MLDLDIDTAAEASAFLDILRSEVWPSPEKAPPKVGAPKTRIVDLVDSHQY